ncbi:penicillin acylase family protein [Streptomyces mexicanus]|jgi:penicillin amidase|uniref:penicillin acylase family protein n=1 Tax=Streptomyces mexicanus TaxID=178566 RepID=UPI0036986627
MRVRFRRAAAVVSSVLTAGVTMFILGVGAGPVPALGQALQPGAGIWPSAEDARRPHDEQLSLPGLSRPVRVSFTSDGVAAVQARTDQDLFTAQGYLAARFRLVQMDVQRRLGAGRLAELNGPSAIDSDVFELTLGIKRTAEATWATTPRDSDEAKALTAYAAGVNARLAELEKNGQWPTVYGLTGVRPARWTPVDSLIVQGVLAQQLSFDTKPLTYALLSKSLGAARASEWFPVLPANDQHPYDPGPYKNLGMAPLATPNANAAGSGVTGTGRALPTPANGRRATETSAATAMAARTILTDVSRLPGTARHLHPNSNAWVAGDKATGGTALLAGDPHLRLSLPSYWYEVALKSPGYDVTGASLPGMPAVLIGRSSDVSWSLTAVQNQSTFFYREKTSQSRPGSYYWKGQWRRTEKVHYTVPVRNAAPVPVTVELTVHGPLLTKKGTTTAVEWTGNRPSHNLAALLKLNRAHDWASFRDALREWHAPPQNFAYADRKGNIGVIAPGYYPQIASGDPRGPLSGTGESDIVGVIPFDAVPQVYNPAGHVAVTANQRPVGADYPYYIGPAANFDPGYRTNRILSQLRGHTGLTAADFASLQNDVTDELALRMVPKLLGALKGADLTAQQKAARDRLAAWNGSMDADSPAAAIWFAFYDEYVSTVFQPWWDHFKVPVDVDPEGLDLLRVPAPLMENLEKWTFTDPANPAFTPPGKPRRTADDALRTAFRGAVSYLNGRLGEDPASWNWGRIHTRVIPSLTGAPALGDGPYPAGGSPRTVNAADHGMTSDFGPSWRMVVGWKPGGSVEARAIYPGGQSDNPASPWYKNLAPYWWKGRLLPLRTATEQGAGAIQWQLRPER